jgi:hypothetical protein
MRFVEKGMKFEIPVTASEFKPSPESGIFLVGEEEVIV